MPEESTEALIDEFGGEPVEINLDLTPRRVVFPLFEIVSNPEIPLTSIRERSFDLIDRNPSPSPYLSATLTVVPKYKSALERVAEEDPFDA